MQVNASNFSFGEYPAGFIKKIYKSFQASIFSLTSKKRLAAFSVLGDWHVPRLREQLRLPERFCIEVIPDGGGAGSKTVDRQVARSHLSIPTDHKVFLFSGIMRADKGLEYLAPTAKRILESFDDVTFVIAGQPFEYSEDDLGKLFYVKPGLQPRLRLILQYLPEEILPYYFSAADCLLLPYSTSYKGSTGPLMKAACTYKLPVIVSNVAAMGEITRENGLGLVVEPEDTDQLFAAIESMIKASQAELTVFADNTEAFGSQNSWSAMASRYEQLFKKLQNGDQNEPNY
jgi:glycosyltransferase involved in cell wall biosynthesis